MADDPYEILGIPKTASEKDIAGAYRKLAKKFHPDLNPGNKRAEERFKRISAANTLLSDPEKRKAYDAGQIDMSGQPQQPRYYRDFAEGKGGARYNAQHFTDNETGDINDILSSLFGRKGFSKGFSGMNGFADVDTPAQQASYTTRIGFMEAMQGAKKRLTMPDGKVLDVSIPPGIEYGQKLRLKGQGEHGGDVMLEIYVDPHPVFTRKGNDILVELPVAFYEAILGSKVQVPTIDGAVSMTLPKGASSGATLRLKGKGVAKGKNGPRGDQLVTLKIVMPQTVDAELLSFAGGWAEKHAYNPRAAMEAA